VKPEETPLFCTDSHAMLSGMPDCRPYDAGNAPVEWMQYEIKAAIRNLPYNLLFNYQNAKAPVYGGQPIPIAQLPLNAEGMAAMTLSPEAELMKLFPQKSALLSMSRAYPYVNSSNESEVRAAMEKYLAAEIKRVGGLSAIFAQTDTAFADREYARFEALLADPTFIKGTTPYGKPFAFSDQEIVVMKQNVKQFYQALQKELIKQEANILAGDPKDTKMKAGELADTLADYLAARANELLSKTTATPLIVSKSTGNDAWSLGDGSPNPPITKGPAITYKLPQFAYDFPVRVKAATFLRVDRSEDMSWGYTQRAIVAGEYTALVSNAFAPIGAMSPDVKTEIKKFAGAPRSLINWLFEVLTIKASL
jgi:hypothetical protein